MTNAQAALIAAATLCGGGGAFDSDIVYDWFESFKKRLDRADFEDKRRKLPAVDMKGLL